VISFQFIIERLYCSCQKIGNEFLNKKCGLEYKNKRKKIKKRIKFYNMIQMIRQAEKFNNIKIDHFSLILRYKKSLEADFLLSAIKRIYVMLFNTPIFLLKFKKNVEVFQIIFGILFTISPS